MKTLEILGSDSLQNFFIFFRFLLKALDQLWHEDCLKCSCCDCRLGEVGSTLYTKANLILCKRDYLRYDFAYSRIVCFSFEVSFSFFTDESNRVVMQKDKRKAGTEI